MKSSITPLFAKFTADDVKDHFSEHSNVFIGIGRSAAFGNTSSNVDDVVFTTNKINELYSNLVGIKKIAASDMQVVLARRDWVSGIAYDAYKDDIELYNYNKSTNIGTANANANTVLTGNANIAASNVLVGNGTSFSTFIFPGDQIAVNLSTKTVVSVTNNTHLIVNSAFANTNTVATITLIGNSTTVVGNSAAFNSTLSPGNTIVIGNDTREVVSLRSNKVISLNTSLTYSNSNVSVFRKDNTFPLYANNFYVRNSRDQVFKCLYNNNSATSTVEPTIDIDGQLPENAFILTGDGYKWKYLYTIPPGLKQKFFTDILMPVANDAAVIAASESGRIDIINVLWGGSGYLSGGNSNTSTILSVTNTDGANANLVAKVSNGEIVSVSILTGGNNYTKGTVTAVDTSRLGNTTIGGTVNASGLIILANVANTSNQAFTGNVYKNDLITISGQTRNVVTVDSATQITVNTAFTGTLNTAIATIQRSDAVFDIEFSSPGGHGSFPAEELGARSLMITVELEGEETTANPTIPLSDNLNTFDFNQISLIQDPLVANGAYAANLTNYRVTDRLFLSDPGTTNFIDDETVFIGTSLATATMVANVAHWDSADNYLDINNITGTYSPSQLIRGADSGAITTILEISESQIKKFTGDVLYISNRKNVTRNENQVEQVKVVLTF